MVKRTSLALLVLLAFAAPCFSAQVEKDARGRGKEGAGGPPPALVAVADIATGKLRPMTEYVGTVYYAHVSEVAAEVEGIVEDAPYDEGKDVKKGQVLVRLSTDLLDAAIDTARASYAQAQAELEEVRKALDRLRPLYESGSVSEALYDEQFFGEKALEQKASGLKSALERLELQRKKKTILSPFGGVVVSKTVEKGEWAASGGTVAVVADDSTIDAVVDVPGGVLGFLSKGQKAEVRAGGRVLTGQFVSVVPRGDVATRTFAVKIRLKNSAGLLEGMEARVLLPSGPETSGLLVPRDAVLNQSGRDVVFVVEGGAARMVPVRVSGYSGLMAGIEGPGLTAGQKVVVKGNERIRDGQPVRVPEK